MRPLKTGLERATKAPIRIAEMIVDGRVLRLELYRPLELLDRFVHIAKPVVGPAERIDDIAVIRALLDRPLYHAHAVIEMGSLIDPGIAEIIEHVRLLGVELERLLQISFRFRPLL